MKKVLLVAMADSIHTARWLEQFNGEPIQFVLFPSSPHRRIHPKLRVFMHGNSKVRVEIPILLRYTGFVLAVVDRIMNNRVRGYLLRTLIQRENPSIVHAMETQGAGYITMRAMKHPDLRPPFFLTLWGSDLYWFQRFPKHRKILQQLLPCVDVLAMECVRDVAIAKTLGFKGRVIPPFPITGGYDIASIAAGSSSVLPSKRKVILVKGHTRFVGKAERALLALKEISHEISDFEVVVYSADPKARRLALRLRRRYGVDITCYKRGALTHEAILDLFAHSRIFLGVSLSDGISVSLQEALVTGAFPIQTDTSCVDEWIIDGLTGFIINPDDGEQLCRALREAFKNDELVDSAMKLNLKTAESRLAKSSIVQSTHRFYD